MLVDTGLLLGFVRGASWALQAQARHELNASRTEVLTSAVCTGELRALAERNGWGVAKRERLDQVLGRLPMVGIHSAPVQAAYARIDAWTSGADAVGPSGEPPCKPARRLNRNDLWVAATAHAMGSMLMSIDRDFEHLDGVWLDFLYVSQERPSG